MADGIVRYCFEWMMRDIETGIRQVTAQNQDISTRIEAIEQQIALLSMKRVAA